MGVKGYPQNHDVGLPEQGTSVFTKIVESLTTKSMPGPMADTTILVKGQDDMVVITTTVESWTTAVLPDTFDMATAMNHTNPMETEVKEHTVIYTVLGIIVGILLLIGIILAIILKKYRRSGFKEFDAPSMQSLDKPATTKETSYMVKK